MYLLKKRIHLNYQDGKVSCGCCYKDMNGYNPDLNWDDSDDKPLGYLIVHVNLSSFFKNILSLLIYN